MHDLGTLGGRSSLALGTSDVGVIVGVSETGAVHPVYGPVQHGFVVDQGGVMHDLAALPPDFLESREAKLMEVEAAVSRLERAVGELSRTIAAIDTRTTKTEEALTRLDELVGRPSTG